MDTSHSLRRSGKTFRVLAGLDFARLHGDRSIFLIGPGESVSESMVKCLKSRAKEMGIDVEIVDKLPSGTTIAQGEEVLKILRKETLPSAAEMAEAFEELKIECGRPSKTPPPKKGHFNRTFGGVGRKHYQR
jgi:hypothetical protein